MAPRDKNKTAICVMFPPWEHDVPSLGRSRPQQGNVIKGTVFDYSCRFNTFNTRNVFCFKNS